jgi:M6 family metalloprotease-like protein
MRKKILSVLIILIFSQLAFQPVFAVKAYPFPFSVNQPDGSQLTIRLQGDENHHYKTSEDGYILKTNSKGFLTYATVNVAGEVVASDFIAKEAIKRTSSELQFLKTVNQSDVIQKVQSGPMKIKMQRSLNLPQKVFPLIGSPKSLVILVNFADTSYVTPSPNNAFTNLLNQDSYSTNGGTGSARDYFMASSYGKFTPDFDVYGPVTLPHKMSFYGANDASGNDVNPVQMIVDACTAVHNNGLDFSQYDTDNDGIIDNVFVYYAGYNEAEDISANNRNVNTIWPHSWDISAGSNYSGTTASITFNGKLLRHYACTSELKGYTGTNMCGIGTFCHEFGHVIGLPDYYDTSGSKNTLNYWSIMDAGSYNNGGRTPPTYSVYDRFFLGFLTPEQISSPSGLTLLPIYQGKTPPANTTNQAFLFSETTHNLNGKAPGPAEFFMIEYRVKTGWDTFLPAEGMCVWHIDFNQAAWNDNVVNNYSGTTQTLASHMRVYLVPPTGVGTTPPTSAFTSGSFTPTTWIGTDINRTISNITKTATNITFNFMPSKMTTTGSITDFSTTLGAPTASQSIDISAINLNENLSIAFQNNVNFEVKLSTDIAWSKSLNLLPVGGNVIGTIQVRYNPTSTGTQTDQLSINSNDLTTVNYNLSGTTTIGPFSPVIFVGKIDNAIVFLATSVDITNTKTINIKTTDLVNDIILTISGANAGMFSVSTNTITKDAANGINGNDITISYLPTSIGNHTATLTISGGGLPDKMYTLSGTAY